MKLAASFYIVLGVLSLSFLPIHAQENPKRVFKAGAATSNITPPLGMEIVGNFAPRPIAAHVHDELHARCLVLDDSTTKLAFVVADTISLSRDVWDEAKQKIEATTGIPAANMMFSGTHTHSSVSALTNSDPSLNYRQFIISRVVDGVRRAVNNLEPARIAWGSGQLPQHVFNRRWKLKEGVTNPNPFGGQDRAVMNPSSLLIPRLAGPAGPANPEVYCLSVQATDGRQIALMANYWLHYVGGVPREHLSADYFGEFSRQVESKLAVSGEHAPVVGMLANGPCGDVNNNDYSGKTKAVKREPYEKIKLVAGDLATEVLRVRGTLEHQDWVPLKATVENLELASRRPTPEMVKWAKEVLAKPKDATPVHRLEQPYAERTMAAYNAKPESVSCVMQAFSIGNLAIAAIPFEVFTEIGLEIKSRSPFKQTFTIELANGSNGYLPTPAQHELGGYETWLGTNRVEREASVKIATKILELLERLK
ncbi:neutral/alkaline ceramidase-like enzyme [Roseimicrobium gellanilyticum]|uniref:Neutral/alkaline ceramidase-like enzyme n=1 Tax=Roseimicrobium gellanilyticum TaxID=748857 RepID=A0A366H7Q3_9BACT|nr:neutral/alkaline non-lysosomal ceramidase N-terminal domain-containing protein [Roseimicrobium gellanilyticum]RBP38086.1 neutral/alkaline ceramidase-like enzyme [Roseimicrobium gellanilyticum]